MDDTTRDTAPVGLLGGESDFGTPIAQDPPSLLDDGFSLTGLLKDNLFKDGKNSVLTVVFALVFGFGLFRTLRFLFVTARWEVIYEGPLTFYMVGKDFDRTGISYGSIWAAMFVVALTLGLGIGMAEREEVPPMRRGTRAAIVGGPLFGVGFILSMTRTITPTLLTLVAVAIGFAATKLGPRLPAAVRRRSGLVLLGLGILAFGLVTEFAPGNINDFGGLLLTVVVSVAGIGLSFPIGVLMALARRSSFPLIRPLAVGYIELVRGVPLISLLFIGEFALRFLFPPGAVVPGSIPRAIIMITLFSGAYVAEIVRGGLQSVPRGQTEAGQAIGLSPVTITATIVLPQALRNSIPALIGQFISLLKDVSLLALIGLPDMLGMVDFVLNRSEFVNQGYTPEAYAFVGAVYWMLCFSMSRAAQRLETRLGVGTR